jgi:hypothetical protein
MVAVPGTEKRMATTMSFVAFRLLADPACPAGRQRLRFQEYPAV